MSQSQEAENPDRRDFVKKASAVVLGGLACAAPVAAGLTVFLDPLQRTSADRDFIKVASMEALPDDGMPRKFSIVADRIDVWNKVPDVPVGAGYLRKSAPGQVEALNVVCPHAGCFVDFSAERKLFGCPCHNSSFAMNGDLSDPKSPSPRGLDSLEVEIRNDTEVWVKFQNFIKGREEKTPVS